MANKIGKYKVSKRERYLDLQDTENNSPTTLTVGSVFDVRASSGNALVDIVTDAKDMIFRQYDDTEVLRIEDNASLQICGTGGLNIAPNSNAPIIKPMTNAKDVIFQQYDAVEVARIHDGADGGTVVSNLDGVGGGFGYKMPVALIDAASGDETVTLTAALSGYIIQCDADSHNIIINLPAITDGLEGITYTFVAKTAVDSGHTVVIKSAGAGADNNDNFHGFINTNGTTTADIDGDTLTMPNSAAAGTCIRLTALVGGAAEVWLAESFTSSGTVTVTDS